MNTHIIKTRIQVNTFVPVGDPKYRTIEDAKLLARSALEETVNETIKGAPRNYEVTYGPATFVKGANHVEQYAELRWDN